MDLFEAMEHRHAVRSYEDRPIAPGGERSTAGVHRQCNRESGPHIQLVLDEPGDSEGFRPTTGSSPA